MRRRAPWVLIGAIVALLATAGVGLSAPGDLDPTFGAGGRAILDTGADEDTSALALQADGRIIVGGSRLAPPPGTRDGLVAVLTPQGGLDPGFGAGFGWSRLDFSAIDTVTAVAQQSSGRIVAAGDTGSGNGFVAGILNPGGTLDPGFGAGNGIFRPAFANARLRALVVQPDDRVVVGGSIRATAPSSYDMVVARLSSGGAIDATYAGGFGWSRLDYPGSTFEEIASGVGLQPDGRIIVAGFTQPPSGLTFGIARLLNPQGTFDSSFGPAGNGTVTVPGYGEIPALAVQPDGGIALAGSVLAGGVVNAIVVRLRAAGTPDLGFSGDGTAEAGPGRFRAVALQRDGKIVAAGETPGPGGKTDVLVMRFQPNGLPDTTFSGDGRATVDLGGADGATALAIQPDGRILVGVTTDANTDVVVLRLQGDAGPGFGPGGPGAGAGGVAGSAAARCAGRAATVIGSNGRDRLKGTAKADVIVGLGGNDVIEALGGDDLVCGGAGADALKGGAGADRLLGEAGADRLAGGAGRDRLAGGAGADRLTGGAGVDVLTGGAGRNVRVQ